MSNKKRSAVLQGIEVRKDAKGRQRYRGTATTRPLASTYGGRGPNH